MTTRRTEKRLRDALANDPAQLEKLLGTTYKARYEALVARLEKEYAARVQMASTARTAAHFANVVDPMYKKRLAQAQAVVNGKPPLTREEFNWIRQAVHPDSSNADNQALAMTVLQKQAHLLRPATDKSEGFMGGLPDNVADLLKMKQAKGGRNADPNS